MESLLSTSLGRDGRWKQWDAVLWENCSLGFAWLPSRCQSTQYCNTQARKACVWTYLKSKCHSFDNPYFCTMLSAFGDKNIKTRWRVQFPGVAHFHWHFRKIKRTCVFSNFKFDLDTRGWTSKTTPSSWLGGATDSDQLVLSIRCKQWRIRVFLFVGRTAVRARPYYLLEE
jgi:hypothetical protein